MYVIEDVSSVGLLPVVIVECIPTYLCRVHIGIGETLGQIHRNRVEWPLGSAVSITCSKHNGKSNCNLVKY